MIGSPFAQTVSELSRRSLIQESFRDRDTVPRGANQEVELFVLGYLGKIRPRILGVDVRAPRPDASGIQLDKVRFSRMRIVGLEPPNASSTLRLQRDCRERDGTNGDHRSRQPGRRREHPRRSRAEHVKPENDGIRTAGRQRRLRDGLASALALVGSWVDLEAQRLSVRGECGQLTPTLSCKAFS